MCVCVCACVRVRVRACVKGMQTHARMCASDGRAGGATVNVRTQEAIQVSFIDLQWSMARDAGGGSCGHPSPLLRRTPPVSARAHTHTPLLSCDERLPLAHKTQTHTRQPLHLEPCYNFLGPDLNSFDTQPAAPSSARPAAGFTRRNGDVRSRDSDLTMSRRNDSDRIRRNDSDRLTHLGT